MSDGQTSPTNRTGITSLTNPVHLGKDYYYPYPDAVVPFAYKLVPPVPQPQSQLQSTSLSLPSSSSSSFTAEAQNLVTLGKQLTTTITQIFPALANSLQQPSRLGTISTSALVFPIHPEVPEMLNLYQLIGWIQYLLRQTSSSSSSSSASASNSPASPWWQRIYLGSPHLFYRSLLSSASSNDYQILDREPVYPSGTWSVLDLEPLHDDFRLNTMLIWRAPSRSLPHQQFQQSPLSPINLLPQYSARQGGIYCGDNRDNWQLAYEIGKAGTFDTCRELYLAQTNTFVPTVPLPLPTSLPLSFPFSGTNRSFQATITLPVEFFQSQLQPQPQAQPFQPQRPIISQSFINEQPRQPQHRPQNDDDDGGGQGQGQDARDATVNPNSEDERKTLQLDTDAMRWQANRVGSSLTQAREDYRNAERELLRLQLTPFLRPSAGRNLSLPQPPTSSASASASSSSTSAFLPSIGNYFRSS